MLSDDHTLLRQGPGSLLGMAADMKVVAEAADGEAAVRQWQALRPELDLMDIRTSGLDGLSAAERITATDPRAGIVILSTRDGEDDSLTSLRTSSSWIGWELAIPATSGHPIGQ